MNERTKKRAGTVVATALAADGLLHAYWAMGRHWPARDARSLAHAVLNADDPQVVRPGVLGPLAGILCLGALLAQARVQRLGRLGRLIPDTVLQVGILVIAAGLLGRGVAGVRWALEGDVDTTFSRLNRSVYTPACLALCTAAMAAARAERTNRHGPVSMSVESVLDGR
jgi:hypothetical protein